MNAVKLIANINSAFRHSLVFFYSPARKTPEILTNRLLYSPGRVIRFGIAWVIGKTAKVCLKKRSVQQDRGLEWDQMSTSTGTAIASFSLAIPSHLPTRARTALRPKASALSFATCLSANASEPCRASCMTPSCRSSSGWTKTPPQSSSKRSTASTFKLGRVARSE